MVIPLVQPDRRANGPGQAVQKSGTEGAAAKTEAELVQIGLQVIFWQTMIGTQNESFGVAEHDVQPVQQTGVGIERLVLMGVAFQRWNVTAVAITADCAASSKCESGKFSDGCLPDVCGGIHILGTRTPLSTAYPLNIPGTGPR